MSSAPLYPLMTYRTDLDNSPDVGPITRVESAFGIGSSSAAIRAAGSPPVVVVFKRRRVATRPNASEPVQASTGVQGPVTDRSPRIFTVRPGRQSEGHEIVDPDNSPAGPTREAPTPSMKRRSRDPLRAPGEVVRTVFEVPQTVVPVGDRVDGFSDVASAHAHGENWDHLLRALDAVRATLDAALAARGCRIN